LVVFTEAGHRLFGGFRNTDHQQFLDANSQGKELQGNFRTAKELGCIFEHLLFAFNVQVSEAAVVTYPHQQAASDRVGKGA